MNGAQDKTWESEAETTTHIKYNNVEDLCIELVNCNLQVPCELVPLMTKVIPLIKAKEYQTIFLPKRSIISMNMKVCQDVAHNKNLLIVVTDSYDIKF